MNKAGMIKTARLDLKKSFRGFFLGASGDSMKTNSKNSFLLLF
jgi:hypothetical protein